MICGNVFWARFPRGLLVTFFIAKKVTMVRPAYALPCPTAHQPNASTAKNSLLESIDLLAFWFALSLSLVSHFPFSRLYGLKKGHPDGSDNFAAQGLASRKDFV